ncbi:MAG: SGNH/GDSL hydrolase family protein [Smithella sp.]|nr:SGNH/GDSL hydrolase family protein [Smithella sp.]
MKKILLKSLLIIVLLVIIFLIPLFRPAGIVIYLRLFLLVWILLESLILFRLLFIDKLRNKFASNFATVLLSLFVLFLLLEAAFMFIPRSHSADYTLASRLWYKKYWEPVNSLGFRDREPNNDKPAMLFVGDSFTAGHGLKSVHDRFSDIVGKTMKTRATQYNAINIGRPNLDTRSEYDVMRNFLYATRIKPAIIVLQYCGNDIEGAAARQGWIFDGFKPPDDMNKFILFIGSGSYLFNYLYFLFPREYLGSSYIAFLRQAYQNDNILLDHKNDLQLFIDYAGQNSIRLIAVVFPFLADIEMSNALYVNDIVEFFEANNVTTINVSTLAKDIPGNERMVNINDSHASKILNGMVAKEILNKLE